MVHVIINILINDSNIDKKLGSLGLNAHYK